jgi:hypothetical protein
VKPVAILILLVAACGGASTAGDDDGDIDVSSLTYKPCAQDAYVGGFDIILGDGFTAVQGQIDNGVTPSLVDDILATDGACAWVRAPSLVCDPGCSSSQTCSPGNVCIDAPVAQNVGTVTVAGMLGDVSMPPRPPIYFYNFTGDLPHPGFAAGAGMRLDAPGFSLYGWGIDALTTPATTIGVQSGASVPVTWSAPALIGPTKVEISLNVNGHGLVGSHVDCVVDDTGSFAIPEPLVTSLLNDHVSGFPRLTVRRTTTDSADTANGCVELDVESAVTLDVIIPGLQSCSGDEDCTAPQTCQPDLTCG